MNHFKILFYMFILMTVTFLGLALLLLVTFFLNYLHLEPELQQVANFDRWGIFGIITAVLCVGLAVLCGWAASLLRQLLSGQDNAIVAEMIYLLGLEDEQVEINAWTKEQKRYQILNVVFTHYWCFIELFYNMFWHPPPPQNIEGTLNSEFM
jgi:hypothetical protein